MRGPLGAAGPDGGRADGELLPSSDWVSSSSSSFCSGLVVGGAGPAGLEVGLVCVGDKEFTGESGELLVLKFSF